jgi:peroxiredoxin Q/BCP
LRRWEALRPDFDALGVALVAISPDTVEEARAMRAKTGLGLTLLSDASLAVTDRYGVRHPKGFTPPTTGRPMIRPLAIPTTFLVDAGGVVRWVDQAEDYRVRSDAARVLAAVRAALGRA